MKTGVPQGAGALRWYMTRYSGAAWTCPEAARQIPDLNKHAGGKVEFAKTSSSQEDGQ